MMDWLEKNPIKAMVVFIVAVLVITVGGWVFQSAMEAKAYNRATGSEVTTWDAMWIELRVQAGPKSE